MKEQSLSDWIEEKEMRGYYTFTIEEVQKNFPQFGNAYISTSLYRLTIKKKIISPWKGFYVIMPIEYALKAIIPPVFYIDALMVFLRKEYYISLLNAASFYGASHQRAQTFSVTTGSQIEKYHKNRNFYSFLLKEKHTGKIHTET